MKNRIEYIDVLRGFAIVLVVIGHTLEKNGYLHSPLHNLIYSFHMPLFFCISGFVTMYACKLNKDSKIRDYGRYILKKFLTIMLPFFVWALIVNPFFFSGSWDASKSSLMSACSAILNNTSYWFLPCLFILIMSFTLCEFLENRFSCLTNKYLRDYTPIIIVGMIVVGGGTVLQNITDYARSVQSYFIPFFIGVLCAKHKKLYELMVNNSLVYTIGLVAFCLIAGYFENGATNKVLRLATGLLSLPVFFHLFSRISIGNIIERLFALYGKYTLVIYVLHFKLISSVPLPQDIGFCSQLVIVGCIAVLVCLVCIIIGKVLDKNNVLSLCLLGKRQRAKS